MSFDPKIFNRAHTITIAVIGDFMLDRYLWGTANRISPESPVPIVVVDSETERLGGAGNVVANVRGLGAQVIPIGAVGEDKAGLTIINKLEQIDCRRDFFIKSPKNASITKTRVFAQKQQVVRVDRETVLPVDENLELLKKYSKSAIDQSNVVIISDYNKGTCSDKLLAHVIEYAHGNGVPTLVDPKVNDFIVYKNCSCITPNLNEIRHKVSYALNTDEDVSRAALQIKNRFNFGNVIITRGEDGMTVLANGKVDHLPTEAREVFDVSGAGDTVISTLAVCLGLGLSYKESTRIANIAAGIVVSHVGTKPISLEELQIAFQSKNVI